MDTVKHTIFNNALNGLIYNEKLNKLIAEAVKNVDRTIDSLRDSQEYMFSQIKREDDAKNNYVSQIINGENMCRVRKPFFTSNDTITPYTNNASKRRQEDGSHDFYLMKHQTWKLCSEKEFETLKTAVGKNVFDIEHAKFLRSEDKSVLKKVNALKLSSWIELSEKCDDDIIDRIDWMTISTQDLKGKINHTDCRRLWEKVFNPSYVYSKWTEAESKILLQLTSELGCQGKWVEIASRLPTKRQPFVCYKRWLELTSKMETSDEWRSEEDEYLCEIIDETKDRKNNDKTINWNKVALLVPNRSAKDCEKRWNSLQLPTCTRPFSDNDDYQLLLLIKKMGTDNWPDIAREMSQRTIEQCQKRYCDIVEELHPWSYLEDRKLWLVLRPYFRSLWSESNQIIETTANLTIYRSIIKAFNGRCPMVLRHRYNRLCKWFYLWNRFYLSLNVNGSQEMKFFSKTTSLLSDSCEEKSILINKILKVILRTSFFDRIRNALIVIGSNDPDGQTNELITMCKSGNMSLLNQLIKESPNQKLIDLLLFVMDLQNGIFIPAKFEDYINRSCLGYKYPDRADNNLRVLSSNVRIFESKTAVSITLHKSLCTLLHDKKVTASDQSCIIKLLECEGKFNSALNYAATTLEKTRKFHFNSKVDLLEKFLPQLLRLMIQYVYREEHTVLSTRSMKLLSTNNSTSRSEQIAELIMYRELIPQIFKTYVSAHKKRGSLGTTYLPITVANQLSKEDKRAQSQRNTIKMLKSQQMCPIADTVACKSSSEYKGVDIPLLPPNRCSLNFLRSFILQKQRLTMHGEQTYAEMVRLRYDNPTKYLNTGSISDVSLTADTSSLTLLDPRYILLRSRLLSLLAVPSVVARISPLSCAIAGDKLHEQQNCVQYSTAISRAFDIVNVPISEPGIPIEWESINKECTSQYMKSCRKRKILESVETDMMPLLEGLPTNVMKISDSQPLTRRVSHRWAKLSAPESGRAFFISKNIFQSCIKNNFTIESINDIKVEEFMN